MSTPAKPVQHPAPGNSLVHHRGDLLEFRLSHDGMGKGHAWLRTNLGRTELRRREIIDHVEHSRAILSRDWCDIPMHPVDANTHSIVLPLAEVGAFQAKAYFLRDGSQDPLWPEGPNTAIKVEPAGTVCGNTLYTAFVRQFGPNRERTAEPAAWHTAIHGLDAARYTVIPPSGTFRDVIRHLDLIHGTMGFRYLQLLPIHPVPTTYARMGRFGSPFAGLDFMDIDPSLAEFDRRTTPMDQFRELVHAVHARHAGLLLDMPINHTGWASALQIHHPEWFARNEDRSFQSPGAWGVTWEDLSRLDYRNLELWRYMADVFLFWCRQGVDGFRCDAGYMIPAPVWEYIIAKVRDQYPDTLFLLEGLGGHPHVVADLLAQSGMNWAYSEIFQNYSRRELHDYVTHAHQQSLRNGTLIHFAETHDNARLAARSPTHARLRTAIAGLFADAGAFGITNGVEWFAREKVDVHGASPLNWGNHENQINHIARINAILQAHPCFEAGAHLRFINTSDEHTLALLRETARGHRLLIAANLDESHARQTSWPADTFSAPDEMRDLLSGDSIRIAHHGAARTCHLEPGQVRCLSADPRDTPPIEPKGHTAARPPARVNTQHQRAKAMEAFLAVHPGKTIDAAALETMASALVQDPARFCTDLVADSTPNVTIWTWDRDCRRTVMIPPGNFLLAQAPSSFRLEIRDADRTLRHAFSMEQSSGRNFALIAPLAPPTEHREIQLHIAIHSPAGVEHRVIPILLLSRSQHTPVTCRWNSSDVKSGNLYALLTNGRGAMAQVRGAWGTLASQYDAMLAANLSPDVPVDRHVMLTRCRAWVIHRGYSQELSIDSLDQFAIEPPGAATWQFTVQTGMGRQVSIALRLEMIQGHNEVSLHLHRLHDGKNNDMLDDAQPVTVVIRPDIEDRINHGKTKAYTGPEQQWNAATTPEAGGFLFKPADTRCLRMHTDHGTYDHSPEWLYMVGHPVDADRGFDGSTDLFSPGYFSFTLKGGTSATLQAIATTHPGDTSSRPPAPAATRHTPPATRSIEETALAALDQFVVARDTSTTIIAGYPWFLDWGRDTLIVLRGLLAAGRRPQALGTLLQFARFEHNGTLPNMIRGTDSSNRDTSDAPLWFIVVCGDCLQSSATRRILQDSCGKRTVKDVIHSILHHYVKGTPNGVRLDPESALIFSPSHFTWMDTNYPAGTPREGYPVEIQALWHRALQVGAELEPAGPWASLAARTAHSIQALYFRKELGFLSDCLHGKPGTPASAATPDDHLRPNQLLAITLDAVTDASMAKSVLAACEELLVPGAIRSLADRPTPRYPLPIHRDGHLLNDPAHPFWGQYRGDEDTRRKPAYHNGTAWSWQFPSYPEALYKVFGPHARPQARAILSSMGLLMGKGCGGQIPEIMDGAAPHEERGCGAQAWGISELIRVQKLLAD